MHFFQATATIIPALLIALAVGAKGGLALADVMEERKGLVRGFVMLWVFGVIMYAFLGEVRSLTALATGSSSINLASSVLRSIIVLFWLVAAEFLIPPMLNLSRFWFWTWFIFINAVYFYFAFFARGLIDGTFPRSFPPIDFLINRF